MVPGKGDDLPIRERTLWKFTPGIICWSIYLEHNARIFEGIRLDFGAWKDARGSPILDVSVPFAGS